MTLLERVRELLSAKFENTVVTEINGSGYGAVISEIAVVLQK